MEYKKHVINEWLGIETLRFAFALAGMESDIPALQPASAAGFRTKSNEKTGPLRADTCY